MKGIKVCKLESRKNRRGFTASWKDLCGFYWQAQKKKKKKQYAHLYAVEDGKRVGVILVHSESEPAAYEIHMKLL